MLNRLGAIHHPLGRGYSVPQGRLHGGFVVAMGRMPDFDDASWHGAPPLLHDCLKAWRAAQQYHEHRGRWLASGGRLKVFTTQTAGVFSRYGDMTGTSIAMLQGNEYIWKIWTSMGQT